MKSFVKTILGCTVLLLLLAPFALAAVSSEEVGPGMVYSELVDESVPWQIRLVEVDVSSPFIRLDAVLGQDGIRSGLERTSSISQRLEQPDDHVAAAVNADFWGGYREPLGMMFKSGELVRSPYERSVFVVLKDGTMLIDVFQLDAHLAGIGGGSVEIAGVNRWDKPGPVLFTHWIGESIPSGDQGKGVVLDPKGEVLTNDCAFSCSVVSEIVHTSGGASMPDGRMVIWFPDGDIHGLKQGDDVDLNVKITPDRGPIEMAVGGGPKIVEKGEVIGNEGSFSTTRHPRTAVGFTEDGKGLILLVVDGRQPGWSLGMSLAELGKAMKDAGAYEAMNLDGGGSSTMVVWHEVKNRPSDNTGERSVASALLVRSTAPQDELDEVRIIPGDVKVIPNSTMHLHIKAKDRHKQPVKVDSGKAKWSVEDEGKASGSVSHDGLLSVGEDQGELMAVAKYEGLEGQARITVEKPATLVVDPKEITIAVGQEKRLSVTPLDSEGNALEGTPKKSIFTVSGDCGTITDDGVFNADKTGDGEVVVTLGGIVERIPLHVSETSRIMVEDFEDLSDWSVSVTRADESACGLIETREHLKFQDKVGKLFYKLESGGTSAVYMNAKDKTWPGKGESAQLWVYGNGSNHLLKAEIVDEDGERFLVTFGYINWKDEWRQLKVSFSSAAPHWANANAKMDNIVGLNNIYIAETNEQKKDQGDIFFDNLEVFTIQ